MSTPLRPHGAAPTLDDVMDWVKTMTTNAYIRGVKEIEWTRFHERVIRDERELDAARKYIAKNIIKWDLDRDITVFHKACLTSCTPCHAGRAG